MTDKVQKIREEVARMHNLLPVMDGDNISVNYAYRICTTLEMYIDSLQEEPVSEDLEKASKEWLRPQLDKSYANYGDAKMMELTHFDGYAMLDAIEFGAKWQKTKDESTTEDLGDYINELSKQFPEVSFAKLARIAVRVAKWQKLQDMGITNKAQDVVDDVLSSADSPLDAYATEVAFMMLPATLKESYHQTNRDRISDAVRLGANWQKKQDQSTIELAGMEKMKEQMTAKAIDVEVKVDAGGYPYIPQMELYDYDNDVPLAKEGDKYKVVLIKEE